MVSIWQNKEIQRSGKIQNNLYILNISAPFSAEKITWSAKENIGIILEFCDHPEFIGDGYCDTRNKNTKCHFDGGDCCQKSWIGDGVCDEINNFQICGTFDGSDCSENNN